MRAMSGRSIGRAHEPAMMSIGTNPCQGPPIRLRRTSSKKCRPESAVAAQSRDRSPKSSRSEFTPNFCIKPLLVVFDGAL